MIGLIFMHLFVISLTVKCYSDLKLFPCDPTFFIVYDNAATIGI